MNLIKNILKTIVIILSCSVLSIYFIRIFLVDSFVVRGHSMEPTYYDSEKVYVNKLLMGARLYTDFDFEKSKLSSFRMPGLRDVEVGDVVIVNYPFARCDDTINFEINYVYLKRCLGIPGDSVSIVNGFYKNNNTTGDIGPVQYQKMLSKCSDSLLEMQGKALKAYHLNKDLGWTIRNFGPLYVPKKGDTITITTSNALSYRKQIQYETGEMPQIRDDKVFIGEDEITKYTFSTNWYFFGGDNVLNSRDSRYIGLMPEEYIIGIVIPKKR